MENNSFEYTYCAERQQEIEAIRKKYLPKEEDKMEQLRRLHSIPTQKAQAASIAIGVLGALILGTGMSLCMTELGAAMGHWAMVIGILVGVLGLIMVALAYPLYNSVLRKERRRIAPEILRLSEELLQ
jgi:hypothetical protein